MKAKFAYMLTALLVFFCALNLPAEPQWVPLQNLEIEGTESLHSPLQLKV